MPPPPGEGPAALDVFVMSIPPGKTGKPGYAMLCLGMDLCEQPKLRQQQSQHDHIVESKLKKVALAFFWVFLLGMF